MADAIDRWISQQKKKQADQEKERKQKGRFDTEDVGSYRWREPLRELKREREQAKSDAMRASVVTNAGPPPREKWRADLVPSGTLLPDRVTYKTEPVHIGRDNPEDWEGNNTGVWRGPWEALPTPSRQSDTVAGPTPYVRRPSPMIQPQVGVTGDLRSRVAHTYGYTPEWYKESRQIPVSMDVQPPEQGAVGVFNARPFGISGSIRLTDQAGDAELGTLAHEQAHAFSARRGYDEGGPLQDYMGDFNRWAYLHPESSPATMSQDAMNTLIDSGAYPEYVRPAETYARTVQFSPGANRQDWPDYVRPYYNGMLQGMDTLSTGESTPPVNRWGWGGGGIIPPLPPRR